MSRADPQAEGRVNSDITSQHIYSAGHQGSQHQPAAPDQAAPEATRCLSRRGALIVISAASLGLWAVLAAVISSLARY